MTPASLQKVRTVILPRFPNVALMLVGFALVAHLLRQWAQRKAWQSRFETEKISEAFPKPFLDQASTSLAQAPS